MHFPAGRPGRTLSVILLCDARTFLTIIPFGNISRDRPAQSRLLYIIFDRMSRRWQRKTANAEKHLLLCYKCSKNRAKIAKNASKVSIFLIKLDNFDKNSSFLLQTIKNCDKMFDGEKRCFLIYAITIKNLYFWRNFQNGKECKSCD